MPVPSSINDLSSTPGSNSPAGSESPSLIDDYLRAHAAFLAALRDGKVSLTGAYADPAWITSLSGAKLIAGSVTTAKFDAAAKAPYAVAADSATTAGSATTASTANAIADGAVSTAAKLASGVVTTPKLADGSVSAAKLDGAQSGAAPIYAARAWVNFNGTGTPAIRASGNVSSITDNGTGNYTVNFATAMPDANYCVVGASAINSSAGDASNNTGSPGVNNLTTGGFRVATGVPGDPSNYGVLMDAWYCHLAVFA